MAAEFIPTVMSRGFHAGPVFGIFGAAIAAAKLGGLDAEQIHGAIAQCVNLAAGNLEGARSGGRSLREGGAVRNALLAVALGPARNAGRRDDPRRRSRLLSRLCRQQPRRTALQLYRRQPGRSCRDHPRPRRGLDLSRNPLPDLFDRRLQHRPCRCDGEIVCGARHRLSRHRPDRGRGQLVGDRVSEPGLSQPRHRATRRRSAARNISPPGGRPSAATRCCAAHSRDRAKATRRRSSI